jgi:AcrR family transcriptional regulator
MTQALWGLTKPINESILIIMARPISITEDQILDAAREIFLEKGFNVSTAEIAKRAGVSEGSLFNRFATKEDLFFAAIGIPAEVPWFATIDRISGTGDVRENLIDLYVEIVENLRQILPRLTLFWASKLPPPIDFPHIDEPPPVRIQRRLTEFFAQEMKLGRIRKCDPKLVAAVYLGGIHHITLVEMMGHQEPIPARRYAEEIMDLLWKALAPERIR